LSLWPALELHSSDADIVAALVDDFSPTALDEQSGAIRVFFSTSELRDAARAALAAAAYDVRAVDVDDEDWARRSQRELRAVTVGGVVVAPPWAQAAGPGAPSNSNPAVVIIEPSMGFGTGHHATTRLCLRALQAIDLARAFVLDVGTGSGVLAIAAARLGAERALGIDHDADAIASARTSLLLNPDVHAVEFQVADLERGGLPVADVVIANLTGTLLVRSAESLRGLVRPGGTLIVSGLLEAERHDVERAFAGSVGRVLSDPPYIVWEEHEDGWVGLGLCCN
jgi:ribosomal protein L11 methyltransferase